MGTSNSNRKRRIELDDERDDAIIDLAEFNNELVKYLFYEIATNVRNIDILKASSGKTLAQIWIKESKIDYEMLMNFKGIALLAALNLLEESNKHWYKEYVEHMNRNY